jgi:hypothetical protein
MVSPLTAACLQSLSEWKVAHAALAEAIQIYSDACLRLDASCAKESEPERMNVEGIWNVYKTLDDAIPTLVSHEKSLHTARAHLERRRNVSAILSPIRKLSTDLLSQIFIAAVEPIRVLDINLRTHQPASPNMTNVLASVCSHWRHIAISTGVLWSECRSLDLAC